MRVREGMFAEVRYIVVHLPAMEYGTDQERPIERQPAHAGAQRDVAEHAAVQVLAGRYRQVERVGWHEYEHGVWTELPSAQVVRDAVAEWISQRVAALREDGRAEEANWWKGTLKRSELDGVIYHAEAMRGVRTLVSELDRGPDLINCANGVLDLSTGRLGRHSPGLLLTRQTLAPYDPEATSDTWDALLRAVPDDVLPWLRVRLGQALTGHPEDSLVLLIGGGANGKSALMSAVVRALGSYAGLVSPQVLLTPRSGGATPELMSLRGLRLALLEETPEEGALDTHQLKTVIGTPTITGRKLYQDDVSFGASHTMIVNTNHYPLVSATDHGTWRRLTAAPFPYRFVAPGERDVLREGERWGDPDIKARVARDPALPAAALAWMVAGALDWYEDRASLHAMPHSVVTSTGQWREVADAAAMFARQRLRHAPGALVPAAAMTAAVNAHLEAEGRKRWAARTIAERLSLSASHVLGHEVAPPRKVRISARHTLGLRGVERDGWTLQGLANIRAWEDVELLPPESDGRVDGPPREWGGPPEPPAWVEDAAPLWEQPEIGQPS
ncbi:MAG: DNA primase family protein [Phycicoccus sp.]